MVTTGGRGRRTTTAGRLVALGSCALLLALAGGVAAVGSSGFLSVASGSPADELAGAWTGTEVCTGTTSSNSTAPGKVVHGTCSTSPGQVSYGFAVDPKTGKVTGGVDGSTIPNTFVLTVHAAGKTVSWSGSVHYPVGYSGNPKNGGVTDSARCSGQISGNTLRLSCTYTQSGDRGAYGSNGSVTAVIGTDTTYFDETLTRAGSSPPATTGTTTTTTTTPEEHSIEGRVYRLVCGTGSCHKIGPETPVTVQATSSRTNATATTTGDGTYTIKGLLPGSYFREGQARSDGCARRHAQAEERRHQRRRPRRSRLQRLLDGAAEHLPSRVRLHDARPVPRDQPHVSRVQQAHPHPRHQPDLRSTRL